MKRRDFVTLVAAAGAFAGVAARATAQPAVEVFKNPSCGCCEAWGEHLQLCVRGIVLTSHPIVNGPSLEIIPARMLLGEFAAVGRIDQTCTKEFAERREGILPALLAVGLRSDAVKYLDEATLRPPGDGQRKAAEVQLQE